MEQKRSIQVKINHERSYEDAIEALNLLQYKKQNHECTKDKLAFIGLCLENVGIPMEDLDKLSVIHVAGTKGKGSTCAYVESILRHKGYRTGFFSSPHLSEVRERIRFNGATLSTNEFTKYFWNCYDQLLQKNEHMMPSYFQFLTVMAFYVFLKEKVDVAIMEVGLGGLTDCTNIVRNPVVCGITHLGIDHTKQLGNTLESIAAHKAGIFKLGTTAVTCPQLGNALEILKETAKEKQCGLYLAPSLSSYDALKDAVELHASESFQRENMALALQLSRVWLHNHNKEMAQRQWVDTFDSESIPVLDTDIQNADLMVQALKSCQLLGRVQVLKRPNITYYLDGAHNKDSIKICCEWFKKKSTEEMDSLHPDKKVVKILLFNITGGRTSEDFFVDLKECNFDLAAFTPNTCYVDKVLSDQIKMAVNTEAANEVCKTNEKTWQNLEYDVPNISSVYNDGLLNNNYQPNQEGLSSKEDKTYVFQCISDTLHWCSQGKDNTLSKPTSTIITTVPSILKDADYVQVLVTGSLYLVGGVLTVFNTFN